MGKIIDGYKKRQNLIIGLLIAAFLVLMFAQTLSIAERFSNVEEFQIKKFSIMRPVGIPTAGDAQKALRVFKSDLGDAYSFDCLYNNVYVLFVMGLVALFMCFKKFNKGFVSKFVTFAYSGFALYSLALTDNLGYVLRTYDSTFIAKVVVAALIFLVSIGAMVFFVIDLAKNSWFKYVNVHIFLNSISTILMLGTVALMFLPFEYEGHTTSIMGFLLLPNHYKGAMNADGIFVKGFYDVFKSSVGSTGKFFEELNGIITIPLLLFLIGIIGSIFNAGHHKTMITPILSIAWAGLCIVGCLLNPLMVLDPKFIIYIVLAVGVIAASVFNIIEHHKANAIYR